MRKVIAFLASLALVAVITAPALAASVANLSVPISGLDAPNVCSSEGVTLYGNLHVSITETSDSAGGKHFDLHLNAQGISGVGDYSGAVYQANGAAHLTLNYNAGGAANGTLPFDFQLVGQGSVPNQNVHALIHYTVNPDGTFTATTVDLSLACKQTIP